MQDIQLMMALAAAVLIISALASGLVERAPISFPIQFLGLGAVLGPLGLGVLQVTHHDPLLESVGVLTLALGVLSILVVRPVSVGTVLLGARMSNAARLFIGWSGPRGLNSLLLILLVAAGVPEAEGLLPIVGMVVAVSVVAHGVTATPLAAMYSRHAAQEMLPEERESTAAGLFEHEGDTVPRWSAEQLAVALASPDPPVVLDVRSSAACKADPRGIPGDVRVVPDQIEEWAAAQDKPRAVVAYCT